MRTENEGGKFCPICGRIVTLSQRASGAHPVEGSMPLSMGVPFWVHDACADGWSEEVGAESEGGNPTAGSKVEQVGLAMALLGKIIMLLFVLAIFGFIFYACFSIAGTK